MVLQHASLGGVAGGFRGLSAGAWQDVPRRGAAPVLTVVSGAGAVGNESACAAPGTASALWATSDGDAPRCDACGSCGGGGQCIGCDWVTPFSDLDCAGRCEAFGFSGSASGGGGGGGGDDDDDYYVAVGRGDMFLDAQGVCCSGLNGSDCLGVCGGDAEEGWEPLGRYRVCCHDVDCAGCVLLVEIVTFFGGLLAVPYPYSLLARSHGESPPQGVRITVRSPCHTRVVSSRVVCFCARGARYCSGAAAVDGCGVCSGPNTGHAAESDRDCLGVCFGSGTCAPTPVRAPHPSKKIERLLPLLRNVK